MNNKDNLYINVDNERVNNLIDRLKVNNNVELFINEIKVKDEIIVNKLDTLENEVIFLASKITSLVKSGVDINKIKIKKTFS